MEFPGGRAVLGFGGQGAKFHPCTWNSCVTCLIFSESHSSLFFRPQYLIVRTLFRTSVLKKYLT